MQSEIKTFFTKPTKSYLSMALLVARLLLMLVSISQSLTVTQSSITSSAKCTNQLPGLMQMASGVDITSLDLFPLGDPKENRGLVENVFNFTCTDGNVLGNLNQKYNYDVPDQITNVRAYNPIYGDLIGIMSDVNSTKQTLLTRLGLEHESSLGAFSQNSKYTSLLKQHFGNNNSNKVVFADIETWFGSFQAFIHVTALDLEANASKSMFSRDFLEFTTQKLPSKYEDNPTAYQTFVQRFGTHYFERAMLPDARYVQFALNHDYWFDTADEQISDNLRVAYYDYFKRWDMITVSRIDKNLVNREQFANASEIVLAYSALKNGSWWKDKLTSSVYVSKQIKDITIRRAVLKPIEDLIQNQTVRSQVAIAVRMHRIEAQLEELANIYNFASDYYQISNEDKVDLENLRKFVNLRDVKQINQMVKIINELYEKVLMARCKRFYDQTIDDLYVTASAKLTFSKQICGFSIRRLLTRGNILPQCASEQLRYGHKNVSVLYKTYHRKQQNYSQYRNIVEQARLLNFEFGLRDEISNGLKASCGHC